MCSRRSLSRLAREGEPFGALPRHPRPVELRALERLLVVRVGDLLLLVLGVEGAELGELAPPAIANGDGEIAVEVGEEEERALFRPFIAHEHQRNMRRQKQHGGEDAPHRLVAEQRQPLTKRPVADLVVVLQEIDEGGGWQMPARLAALLAAGMLRRLALIGEALGQRAGDMCRRVRREVFVIAFHLAGRRDMRGIVEVVVPFGGEKNQPALVIPLVQTRDVAIVLGGQMDVPVRETRL